MLKKFFEDMTAHFDTTHKCDRQQDRHTEQHDGTGRAYA